MIAIFIILGYERTEIVSAIGLFGGAAFRLMPSINRIFNSIGNLKFSKQTVDSIFTTFQNEELNNQFNKLERVEFTKTIEVKSLTFKHQHSDKLIFDNNNIQINRGDVIGVIGASGSGKTTLIGILMGLLESKDVLFLVDGKRINPVNQSWQQRIAYVPQEVYLLDDTIKANITFGESHESVNQLRLNNAIASANLSKLIQASEESIDHKVAENGASLSGGQKQRIGIARALYANGKDILILDEATSALDTFSEREIIEI